MGGVSDGPAGEREGPGLRELYRKPNVDQRIWRWVEIASQRTNSCGMRVPSENLNFIGYRIVGGVLLFFASRALIAINSRLGAINSSFGGQKFLFDFARELADKPLIQLCFSQLEWRLCDENRRNSRFYGKNRELAGAATASGTYGLPGAGPSGSGRRFRNGSGGPGPAACRRGCRAAGARTGSR